MGCVIDHLERDHRLRVLEQFTDLRGVSHAVGETGVLRHMELDWAAQEILLTWERDGQRETMVFALAAKQGPRNGAMKRFFEKGDYVEDPQFLAEHAARAAARRKRQVPEVAPGIVSMSADRADPDSESREPAPIVTEEARFEEGLQRIWALVARQRFDDAAEQIDALLGEVGEFGWRVERLAGHLETLASAHAEDADRATFDWLCERAVSLWYAWGAMATGAGEGEVRGRQIKAARIRIEGLRTT